MVCLDGDEISCIKLEGVIGNEKFVNPVQEAIIPNNKKHTKTNENLLILLNKKTTSLIY